MSKYIVMIPNAITFLRMLMAFFLTFLITRYIGSASEVNPMIMFVLFGGIYVTDFADGRLARYLGVCSRLGSILDITADFICIIMTSLVLVYKGIIPVWFVGIIIFKLVEFIFTSLILKGRKENRGILFVFDYLGRIGAVMFYTIPCLGCILYFYMSSLNVYIIHIVVLVTTVLCFASTMSRVLSCCRVLSLKQHLSKLKPVVLKERIF